MLGVKDDGDSMYLNLASNAGFTNRDESVRLVRDEMNRPIKSQVHVSSSYIMSEISESSIYQI